MLKQGLQQKLLQKLSPQQIQLMKLLQIPTVALEQRIKEEMEINPALDEGKTEEESGEDEFDNTYDEAEHKEEQRDDFNLDQYISDDEIPSYKMATRNTGDDDDRKEIPFSGGSTFHELLVSQLGLRVLDDHEFQIAEFLIGNIDDDGYLRRDLNSIVDDLAFSQNIDTEPAQLEKLLKIIHEFDPPGVGARDLQECLALQIRRKLHEDPTNHIHQIALDIIEHQMEEFSKKHYDKIQKKLGISDEELKEAIHEIIRLNPKPGNSLTENQKTVQDIVPDFIINNNDGVLELSLNSKNAPELRISRTYSEMLEQYSKSKTKDQQSRDAVMFVKQKIDAAKWFIEAIQQRQQTLLTTMNAIMNYQYEFFVEGDDTKLRPMILKDISEIVGLDISTISRVANSKYVQTQFGTFLLKHFFSESLSTDSGEEVSTREVKKILSDCIGAESKRKPLTDEKLTAILREKGYNIARRTVAKYREQLNIPVARLRKEL
jgi:RNA polymerase sigma-54 factor